ncbi:uncharacterized protein LOC108680782 [Hyalella azteca]|uniref:Uncharacterized protein LOC108680782 n=1 Tax=Hyalella azteca TaxID=294128 RepID=A0A8B7PGP3_HYAAZ|nr:uncharacterized protein LOC108680782 [Hyalella azteca]
MGAGYAKEDGNISPKTKSAIKSNSSLPRVRRSFKSGGNLTTSLQDTSLHTGEGESYRTEGMNEMASEELNKISIEIEKRGNYKFPEKLEKGNPEMLGICEDISGKSEIEKALIGNGNKEESKMDNNGHGKKELVIDKDEEKIGLKVTSEFNSTPRLKSQEIIFNHSEDKSFTPSSSSIEGEKKNRKSSTELKENLSTNLNPKEICKDLSPRQASLNSFKSHPDPKKEIDFRSGKSNSIEGGTIATEHIVPSITEAQLSKDQTKSKKDSRRLKMKKKTSIDVDWSKFKFASSDGNSVSRKPSQDCDDTSAAPSWHRPSKGSFDLGRVALRFTKRSSTDKGIDGPALEEEPPPAELTQEQKIIIKETWAIVKQNVERVGVIMFTNLFETHPDVQEVFLPLRGMEKNALLDNKKLRNHALRVMGFVEKAVGRLEEPAQLQALLETCGRNHCGYGAALHHIDLVGPQLLEAIKPSLEDRWSPEISTAWTLLMDNIAYAMKAAMRLQMRQA